MFNNAKRLMDFIHKEVDKVGTVLRGRAFASGTGLYCCFKLRRCQLPAKWRQPPDLWPRNQLAVEVGLL